MQVREVTVTVVVVVLVEMVVVWWWWYWWWRRGGSVNVLVAEVKGMMLVFTSIIVYQVISPCSFLAEGKLGSG